MQLKDGYIYFQTGEDVQLTSHFNTREFECKEPDATDTHKISMELVSLMQIIRSEWGYALKITSGYRTSAYQQKLRDAGYQTAKGISQHELGNAVDFKSLYRSPDFELTRLDNIVHTFFKTIGRARTFTHVDTRRDKQRFWHYGKS